MPTIVSLSGTVRLCISAGDHSPPHFHVLTGDGNAFMVRLDTLQVLAGRVDPKAWRSPPPGRPATATSSPRAGET